MHPVGVAGFVALVLSSAIAGCGDDETQTAAGAGGGGAGGAGSGGETTGSGGTGGSTTCGGQTCDTGWICCGEQCVDPISDIFNCGGCGIGCVNFMPYCQGSCMPAPCDQNPDACGDGLCCGQECCQPGTICCYQQGGAFAGPVCTAPVDGTCPGTCHDCP